MNFILIIPQKGQKIPMTDQSGYYEPVMPEVFCSNAEQMFPGYPSIDPYSQPDNPVIKKALAEFNPPYIVKMFQPLYYMWNNVAKPNEGETLFGQEKIPAVLTYWDYATANPNLVARIELVGTDSEITRIVPKYLDIEEWQKDKKSKKPEEVLFPIFSAETFVSIQEKFAIIAKDIKEVFLNG